MFDTEIKTALKAAGLSEDLHDKITVKTSDEITGAVAQLKTILDKGANTKDLDFLKAIEGAGLGKELEKFIQAQTDKRVTEAIKTHDQKLKDTADEAAKKAAEDAKLKEEKDKAAATMSDEQKEIASLKETVEGLQKTLTQVVTNSTTSEIEKSIRSELTKAGLSEDFYSDIKTDDPAQVGEAVKAFKTKFDAHQQKIIDTKLEAGDLSLPKGDAGKTLEASEIADYAKSIGTDGLIKNPDFQGKISSEQPAKAVLTAKE